MAHLSPVSLHTTILAWHLGQPALHGGVEDSLDERRLATAAHSRDHGEHIEGETDVHALEVVHAAAFQPDNTRPLTARGRERNLVAMGKKRHGVGRLVFEPVPVGGRQILGLSLVHDFSAQASCVGSHVDDLVGSPHDVLVVFHHHHGVALVAQVAQHVDETVRVAAMQSDGRFVEDVERSDKRTAQSGTEAHTLALATTERIGGTVQGEVVQSHLAEEVEAVAYLGEQSPRHVGVMVRQG